MEVDLVATHMRSSFAVADPKSAFAQFLEPAVSRAMGVDIVSYNGAIRRSDEVIKHHFDYLHCYCLLGVGHLFLVIVDWIQQFRL